ncbi:uncharacterized protein LOC141896756 isoform X2 [Acropora palmata]
MMAQKDELEPIPIHRRDFLSSAGRHAPQMLKNDGVEGDNLPQGVVETTPALLNVHKKDGAKEYMESKKVNEKGQVVERQLQMPPRVFELLSENAELSDSGQEQDERERMRPLSEGLEVTPKSSTDSGFDETMDLSCELSVPQHSGNDLKRSMEDCSQQKIATIVYRAGTKDGPSFDSDENINEGWLVTNPELYFPLDQDQLPESCKERLEGIFLWEADVSTLGEGLTSPYDGVIKVELNDSNYKYTPKEIKTFLKSLKWQKTTVPQCSGGLSLMDLSPLVQAVIVYMKDHYPTTPEELNFHAELKAASQWYWLKDNGNTSALKKVPADDCRLKIAVRETLKTWEKEKEDLKAKPQRTDDSDEELSDATEAIEVLKNYLGENKKDANFPLGIQETNAGTYSSVRRAREDEQDTLQDLSKLRHKFPHFVNRKTDELSHIVNCLGPENEQCQVVFIDGATGIGKTTLATEAANKLRNDNKNVVVAYIYCKDIKSLESFAGTIIEQICRSPSVDDPAAEIKKRLIASKNYFYILFLDSFEVFLDESNGRQHQPSTGGAAPYREEVLSFIDEIAKCTTNIKFLVTSSERVAFPTLATERIHLNPFDKDESFQLLEKVRRGDEISVELSEELCKICSGIPLVLHTLISSQEDLIGVSDYLEKAPPQVRTDFLQRMKAVPKDKKIEGCLNLCFQRLTPQVQLTLLHLCLYKGLFTPEKATKIFCSSESSEHNLRAIVLELGRGNLLHLQKFQDTNKYTFLTVIREHFKLKAKQEYRQEIQHARGLLIDYLISFLKETFKVFLGKNTVKSAIEEFSAEKENVMQLVEWINKNEMDEERVKKCIDVFNVAGEMLAKMMAKFNYRYVYESLAKKCREMGDQRRRAECLTSLGIKEIFNCICVTGLCDKAIERARPCLDEADWIQTHLQVNEGNSRAQCLAKLGRCVVRSGDKERGEAMIEEAIRIRNATFKTRDDHEKEGGENVCHVMLGATYNDKAVALSFENHHREAVNIRKNQVMKIYTQRLGDHPFTATILNNLSNNHRDLGEFGAAEEYAKEALRIRRELLADHRDTAKSLFDLGVALKANGKFREAKGFLEQCKTMQEKVVNDSTFEKNLEEQLRDVNRLLEMQQSEGQDQLNMIFEG